VTSVNIPTDTDKEVKSTTARKMVQLDKRTVVITKPQTAVGKADNVLDGITNQFDEGRS